MKSLGGSFGGVPQGFRETLNLAELKFVCLNLLTFLRLLPFIKLRTSQNLSKEFNITVTRVLNFFCYTIKLREEVV